MPTKYTGKPCAKCGRKKGSKQADHRLCFTCGKAARLKASQDRHDSHVQRHYGITKEEYAQLLAFQAGKCAICCRATGRSKRLAVDHDHSCKEGHDPKVGCPKCVRGLLCSTCNKFIGWNHDDPRVGDRMGRYLREPPFRQDHRPLRVMAA
jgi:hypothetical protein